MQNIATDELYIEVTHGRIKDTFACFADQCETLGQEVVQRLAAGLHLLFPLSYDPGKIFVCKGFHFRFQLIDLGDNGVKFLEISVVLRTEKELEHSYSYIY